MTNYKDRMVGEMRPVDKLFPKEAAMKTMRLCPTCGEGVGTFRNAISEKEYRISGMCQECQDSVFGVD